MKIINLFGGPGVGKSSTAYMLAGYMKWKGLQAELVTEYAKDIVWKEAYNSLNNQIYVTAQQYNRLFILKNKVDYVVNDSPILLGLVYGKDEDPGVTNFKKALLDIHNSQDTLNVVLTRMKEYNPIGRVQSEEDACELDKIIKKMLDNNNIFYYELNGDENIYKDIFNLLR